MASTKQDVRTLIGVAPTDGINVLGKTIIRIGMPLSWDPADLYCEEQVSTNGVWRQMRDQYGDPISFKVDANYSLTVDPNIFRHSRQVRFYSSVAQSTLRSIEFITVDLKELIPLGAG